MAVQAAQYPSNVLLSNRTGQDGYEFQLQQQSGGIFIHQSHMLFNNNNNSNNSRKRGRQVAGEAITEPINSFSLQNHQPSQLIELSQLHRPNVLSTGLRLSFSDKQQKLQQNQNQNQNQSYQQSNSTAFLSMVSDDLATQIKRQRDELEHFLQAQGDELRRGLAEKRNRHYRALLGAAEESLSRRIREKEAEVQNAKCRNVELQTRATQLSVEAQVWQAKARAQEATAASLQAQIHHAMMSGVGGAAAATREECGGGGLVEGQAEDCESGYVDPERVMGGSGVPGCKGCRTRVATVLLLPCRHLCLCIECDGAAQACPLCLTIKNSSVEVFLS